jgi:hypothetical protein
MCIKTGSTLIKTDYTPARDNTNVKVKTPLDNPVVQQPQTTITPKDESKVKTKTSSKEVIHSVDFPNKDTTPKTEAKCFEEKCAKTISGVIGNTQDIIMAAKKAGVIAQSSSGLVAKASGVVGAIASNKVVQKVDKIVNTSIANKTFGVFAVVGGGFEIARGVKEIKKGNTHQGVYNIASGGTSVVTGVALGVGATSVAAVAGGVGLGVMVVKYGNDSVKEQGWLKSKDGKNQSSFERLEERAGDLGNSVEKATGSKFLGTTTKIASGIAMVPAAVVVSVGGAVVGAGKAIGGAVSGVYNYFFGD